MGLNELKLRWQGGFIGSDSPPHENSKGCPEFENVRLANNDVSLRSYAGVAKILENRLEDVTQWPLDNRKKIALFDAEPIFGAIGVGYAVVDYSFVQPFRRVLAIGFDADAKPNLFTDPRTGLAWDPSSERILMIDPVDFTLRSLPEMNRVSRHEYPDIINSNGETFILDSRGRGIVFRGGRPSPTGIMRPPMKPVLLSRGSALRVADDCEAPSLLTGQPIGIAEVELVSPTGVGSSLNPTDPFVFSDLEDLPIYDNGGLGFGNLAIKNDLEYCRFYVKQPIDPAVTYDLVYRNRAITFAADDKRVRFGIYWTPANQDKTRALDKAPHRVLEPNTLALAFGSAAALGGTQNVLPINVDLPAGEWVVVDLPMAATPGIDEDVTLPFSAASWGIRLLKPLPPSLFPDALIYQFRIDKLEIITIADGVGRFTGKWRARTTLTAPGEDPRQESDPSFESDEIDFRDTPTNIAALVQGFRGSWDTIDSGFTNDSVNFLPENLYPNKLKYLVYLHTPDFGRDALTGQRLYRLAGEANRDAF